MNDLLTIALGAGLHDGLNPCIFMTCAVFIVYGFSMPPGSWLRVVFVLLYILGFTAFNFGPAQILVLRKEFVMAGKFLYLVLGIWTFILGILFLIDWFLLQADSSRQENFRGLPGKGPVMNLAAGLLPVVLSALATLAPVNNYMMLLANEALLKGQWQTYLPLTGGYVLSSMWPLWFVWAFLSIKNLKRSLLKIVCASVFFTASSCTIFMFK